ncbi:MAG TPA: translation initiation factor IF-2 [Syntrophorhabdaceae bacterium]|jgi:translation initiation factor IF-2|nr:translation initiation factor IF-2 [Syntrophorhabdaceae bacterium]HOF56974.1 translation initiation factor IF-2 [Syntrophorhabdaceae bacterium]HOS04511.1 translation initiation factor IF-2 [Syntrophorhabdaceae bacterium]HPL40140.1 translation initiation factor IF-2 [Syntrophorhabdaceae bacterium]
MSKIKLTTLTDKIGDEEILSKLKNIGVKVKEGGKEGAGQKRDTVEKVSAAGETMVEKRVASTIIRRRVHPVVPAEKREPKEEKIEIETSKEAHKEIAKKTTVKSEKISKIKEAVAVELKEVKKIPEPETTQVRLEPLIEEEKKIPPEEIGVVEAKEKEIVQEKDEISLEEKPKGDIEHIAEEKKIEITKVLEEAYKKDLDKNIILGDKEKEEEERKRKKAEKLLKKIEEQEFEEQKLKKKGVVKKKVVIKEEDLYTFKRQKPKGVQSRKGRRGKGVEKRIEEEKKIETKIQKRTIKIGDEIQVDTLAKKMGIKAQDIILKLLPLGIVATVNKSIDFDTAYLVATELGFEVEKSLSIEEAFQAQEEERTEHLENLKPRSPVVTIMGHVDHGKTLLLDTIRHTKVAEREAGGITQHIGAYKVNVHGKEIAFVDTPGHEAFTAMRARGAKVTDIVVLVVAADDGVMPQTIEAIDHAKAANVPIIVAINKIDRQNANPDRVTKELADAGLVPEEWGGTTLYAKISAKKKIGIKELLELIILQAEMLELKANADKTAKGIIIESELDKGQGPVGTVIIQEGTLKIQDPFIAGTMFGRVRAMIDDKGHRINKAPPSTPVLVVGFQDVPQAGDHFIVTTEERYAKELSKFRQERLKQQELAKSSRTTLEDLYSKIGDLEKATLCLIIKGDVRGTIDAITETLKKMSNQFVEIQIVHSGVGAITETDVNLAMASGAIIVGFNTRPISKAQALAEQEKIEIRTYSVIYDMIDDIKKAMEGMLAPKIVETVIGKAEVRKVFSVSKIGTIAGSYLTEGKATRNSMVRVVRDGNPMFTGKLLSLKRFKDDVKEVQSGYECGIGIDGYNDIKEGDIFEFFIEEKEKQSLDD